MRIRKLIAQKKISEPNSNILTSSPPVTPTKTIIPSSAAADVSVSSEEEEEERLNDLQEKEVVVCELNMSFWDVIPVKELRYYFPKKNSKAMKKKKYDDERIRDESVNAGDDQISVGRDDTESKEDDEKTEEKLVEKQYATAYKRKLWLKSLTKNGDKKRKRDCGGDNEEEKKKKRVAYCCKTDHQRDNNQEKKIQKLEKKTARRGRLPKESSSNTTTIRGRRSKGKLSGKKSSEFYYYSGFGPLWGKNKRGRPLKEVKKQQVSEEEDAEEEDAKVEECVKLEEMEEIINEAPIDHHRTSPKINIVKEENVNGNDDNGCMFVDDDFDDDSDEDCNGVDVKKRYRKPIKARSLASLFSNS
ncbi:hypothetical protein MKW98_004220 [Papaver atlanticum]|uniref:Uncharacterized protein n=1 Tax=Papaver atlanticum TaxID=357466 RepID=A0AAD4T8U3_9MAGN|nr:hypothetical protein MKW98_004220 [Papaver atlanticum]